MRGSEQAGRLLHESFASRLLDREDIQYAAANRVYICHHFFFFFFFFFFDYFARILYSSSRVQRVKRGREGKLHACCSSTLTFIGTFLIVFPCPS